MHTQMNKVLRFGGLLFFLAALLLLTSCSFSGDPGVNCLGVTDDGIIAYSFDSEQTSQRYISTDGGFTWDESGYEHDETFCEPITRFHTTDQAGQPIIYKLGEDHRIGYSLDDEATWLTDHWITPLTHTEEKLYESRYGADYIDPGNALRAVKDPSSGNLVFAMAVHGVMVREPDGTYTDISIGPFQRLEYTPLKIFLTFADHFLILALIIVITMTALSLLYNEFFNSIMANIFLAAVSMSYLLLAVYSGWPVWIGLLIAAFSGLIILTRTRIREALPLTPKGERRKIIVGGVLGLPVMLIPYWKIAGDVQQSIDDSFYWYVIAYIVIQVITGLLLMLKPKPKQEIKFRGS